MDDRVLGDNTMRYCVVSAEGIQAVGRECQAVGNGYLNAAAWNIHGIKSKGATSSSGAYHGKLFEIAAEFKRAEIDIGALLETKSDREFTLSDNYRVG